MTKKDQIKLMRQRRDAKMQSHLAQYAPVWLVDDVSIVEDEALQFDIVFLHPHYGWVRRRYRYDAFNDVLYHKGQIGIREDEALALEDEKPYISAGAINTINSYGG